MYDIEGGEGGASRFESTRSRIMGGVVRSLMCLTLPVYRKHISLIPRLSPDCGNAAPVRPFCGALLKDRSPQRVVSDFIKEGEPRQCCNRPRQDNLHPLFARTHVEVTTMFSVYANVTKAAILDYPTDRRINSSYPEGGHSPMPTTSRRLPPKSCKQQHGLKAASARQQLDDNTVATVRPEVQL